MNKFLRITTLSIFLLLTGKVFSQDNQLKISQFTVTANENKVMINWKSDAAESNYYFAIQKSTDGVNYKTIALVLGPDPKKDDNSYGAYDKEYKAARQYYRLVKVNPDGTEQISQSQALAKT